MLRTSDLIDRLKAAYGLPSDYAVAKKLGITRSAVSRYRTNQSTLDDNLALELAELLELSPLSVMACVHAERAERHDDKNLISFWRQYAA